MTRTTENRIPFGLRDGAPVEVSEVEFGLACSCVCPSCKRPLQARKGKIRSHYFAHDPSAGAFVCASAFETSIHPMAKEILKDDGSLVFPGLAIKRTAEDLTGKHHTKEIQIEEAGRQSFESVELEKRLDDIRPDIIAYIDGDPLAIEVAVTSFVRKEKKQKIRKLGLPAVEIDLSSVSYTTTKEELRNLINSESTKKVWLSNPKAIEAKRDLKANLEAEIQRINEAIRLSTRRSPVQASLSSLRGRQIHTIESHGETRWFLCESCSDVFEMPLPADSPSIRNVTCPNCRCAVSTDPRRIRY